MASTFFGIKKYPTPVLKPLWPFAVAGVITYYLIGKGADASAKSDQWKNDPRNPNLK